MGQTSPKGDGVSSCCLVGGAFGDMHIGKQRRRLDGLPWLWTGSKSRVLFRVAQAIFLLPLTVATKLKPESWHQLFSELTKYIPKQFRKTNWSCIYTQLVKCTRCWRINVPNLTITQETNMATNDLNPNVYKFEVQALRSRLQVWSFSPGNVKCGRGDRRNQYSNNRLVVDSYYLY